MRPACLLIVASVMCASAASAQEAGPRTDALLTRAEHGDLQARKDAETLAWQWIKLTAEKGRLDPESARTMARTMLIVLGPPTPPYQPPTPDQRPLRSAAVIALTMALSADSADAWSAAQLEQLAPYPYIWMSPADELATLRALQRRQPKLPSAVAVTRIRMELEVGVADSAAAALAMLPASALSNAARGHLAAEVAFAQRKDSLGAAAYYDGAAAIHDSSDAAWYGRDLLWTAQLDELTEWDTTAHAAREHWLEKFWNRRDIRDGQLPGTRLSEQFRRWRVALRDFRWQYDNSTARGVPIPRQDAAEFNELDIRFPKDSTLSGLQFLNRMRPLSQVLDDRGGLYLRHGEPATRVNLPGRNALSEETMMWQTPAGPLIVSFSRMADSVQPPNNPRGKFASATNSWRFGMVARNFPEGDLIANCAVDSRLCVLAAKVDRDPKGASTFAYAANILNDFVRMREIAEKTDGNMERFKNSLDAVVQVYGIPDLGALVVYAVPVKQLTAGDKPAAPAALSARLRAVAGNSSRGEFANVLDTVRTWTLKGPPNDSSYVTGFTMVPTPTGEWSVTVVMSNLARTAGTGQQLGDISVSAFDGKTLQLSDMILGSPGSGLSWQHDGVLIPLNPRNAWRPTEPAILSYELDGLVVGRRYETHVEIWETAGNPKTFKNSVAFTAAAGDTRNVLQRELSLKELAPGDYRVVLRIRDTVTGAEVTRDRRLAVRK